MMYVQDYDETYPMLRCYGSFNTSIPQEVAPYIQRVAGFSANDPGIWRCPSDTADPNTATPGAIHQSYDAAICVPGHRPPQAGVATPLTGVWDDDTITVGTTTAYLGKGVGEIPAPAGSIMMVETTHPDSWLGSNFLGIKRPYMLANANYFAQDQLDATTLFTYMKGNGGWHSDGWNYVYADGHVKFQRPDQTVGKGVNGNGKDRNGNTCMWSNPCGGWTLDPDD